MWAEDQLEGEMASNQKGAKLNRAAEATPFDLETCGAQHKISMASRWALGNLKSIGQKLWEELALEGQNAVKISIQNG